MKKSTWPLEEPNQSLHWQHGISIAFRRSTSLSEIGFVREFQAGVDLFKYILQSQKATSKIGEIIGGFQSDLSLFWNFGDKRLETFLREGDYSQSSNIDANIALTSVSVPSIVCSLGNANPVASLYSLFYTQ